jgi:hypothetical protein
MKKLNIFFVSLFLLNIHSFAQELNPEKRAKMEKLKQAFILIELELEEEKEAEFRAIYEAYQSEKEALQIDRIVQGREIRSERVDDSSKLMALSEAEALERLESRIQKEQERLDLEKKYLSKMVESIGAKKVLQYKMAEHNFRRHLLRMFKDEKHRHHMESELIKKRKGMRHSRSN